MPPPHLTGSLGNRGAAYRANRRPSFREPNLERSDRGAASERPTVDATLVDDLVRSGWPRTSARTAARGAQNNRARAETILKMPGFVKEEDMRPFVAELVGMGFGPAESMVLDALKQAKGNKLT